MSGAGMAAPRCLPPIAPSRSPSHSLPAATCDCHFHVFAEGAPFTTPRSYTPHIATFADWRGFAAAAGIERGILVQPSVYGMDNRVLLAALEADPVQLRAIVVVDATTPGSDLAVMDTLGVRGVRINTRNKGGLSLAALGRLAARLAPMGWHIQLQVHPQQLSAIEAMLPRLGLPIVIDHLGLLAVDDAAAVETGVGALRRLMDRGECYVKISAPYRLRRSATFDGVGTLVRSLVASHPERLLWGSDWPHTELWQDVPDDVELVEAVHDLLAGEAARRSVFALNADRLFFSR